MSFGRAAPIRISLDDMTVPLIPVESSAVISLGYDENIATMYVQWKTTGYVYAYTGVSEDAFYKSFDEPSIGRYVNKIIKGLHYCIPE